jgi:hypothetical protein
VTLLEPGELAAIQSLGLSGMSSAATILTRSIVETADGQESVWATNGEDVACWVHEITAPTASLGTLAGAVGLVEVFDIRVPIGSDAHSGDRVAIGSTLYDIQHTSADDTYPVWLHLACRAAAD